MMGDGYSSWIISGIRDHDEAQVSPSLKAFALFAVQKSWFMLQVHAFRRG